MQKKTIVKLNISMEASLLEQIDAYCDEHGFTRSGFLAACARDRITSDDTREQIKRISKIVDEFAHNPDAKQLDPEDRHMLDAMRLIGKMV